MEMMRDRKLYYFLFVILIHSTNNIYIKYTITLQNNTQYIQYTTLLNTLVTLPNNNKYRFEKLEKNHENVENLVEKLEFHSRETHFLWEKLEFLNDGKLHTEEEMKERAAEAEKRNVVQVSVILHVLDYLRSEWYFCLKKACEMLILSLFCGWCYCFSCSFTIKIPLLFQINICYVLFSDPTLH